MHWVGSWFYYRLYYETHWEIEDVRGTQVERLSVKQQLEAKRIDRLLRMRDERASSSICCWVSKCGPEWNGRGGTKRRQRRLPSCFPSTTSTSVFLSACLSVLYTFPWLSYPIKSFINFRALKSVDQRFCTALNSLIGGFWGHEVVKGSVGLVGSSSGFLFSLVLSLSHAQKTSFSTSFALVRSLSLSAFWGP